MKIKTIDNFKKDLNGSVVLMRVDFNVPMDKNKIKEDFKIAANVLAIKDLLKQKAIVLLVTHLGDPIVSPTGRIKDKEKFSTKPLAVKLSKLIKKSVVFLSDSVGSQKLGKAVDKLLPGQVALLENIRFYSGESKDDNKFAKQLASLADIYINNAFAVSHRKHASVSAVKKYLPSFAGSLLAAEVENLSKILKPKKPLVAVIGGAKIDSKVAIIKKLVKVADKVLIGGAVANNFLAARGHNIGASLSSLANIKLAKKIDNKKKIIIPVDVIVGDKNFKNISAKKITDIKPKEAIYDIGPETMKIFAKELRSAKTIVWNGPMGLFEQNRLQHGTMLIARTIAMLSSGKAFGVVGGGETVEALKMANMLEEIDWVSTGGGASLSFLGGERMPGLEKLIK